MSELRTRSATASGRWLAVLLGLGLGLWSPTASAQDSDQRAEAKQHFRAGQQAFDAGQYLGAARAFEESYKILPIPEIAFSMAQAYRLQYLRDKKDQWLDRALELYRVYVAKKPRGNRLGDAITHIAEIDNLLRAIRPAGSGPTAKAPEPVTQVMITSLAKGAKGTFEGKIENLPLILDLDPGDYEVEIVADGYFPQKRPFKAIKGRFITVEVTLKPKPAQVEVEAETGVSILVDGRPLGETPLVRPLDIEEGSRFVAATKRGHVPWTQQVELTRGQEITLKPKMRITTRRKFAYGFGGLTVLGGLGTTIFSIATVAAQARAKEIDDERVEHGSLTLEQLKDFNDARDLRNRNFGYTVGFALLTGGALVAGTLLYYIDNPRVERPLDTPKKPTENEGPSILSVTPTAGLGMTGVTMTGRF